MNKHRAGRALAEATVCGDIEAARRHGVTRSTVSGWRKRLTSDPELQRIFAGHIAAIDGAWRRELQDTASQAARDLRSLEAAVHELVLDVLAHPEAHADARGEIPSCVDRIRLAQGAMSEIRANLASSAEMLTHYAAIVAEPEERDGGTRQDRENGAPPAGGAAVTDSSSAVH